MASPTHAGALRTPVVLADLVPGTRVRNAALVLAWALLTRRGALSQLLYVALGLMLPVYASGAHGPHVLWGPTGGYLVGFVLAAGAMGLLAERGVDRTLPQAVVGFTVAQLLIFGIGVPWLKISADLDWSTAVHSGFTVFIAGGIVKAVTAGAITPTAWRLARRVEDR